MTTAFEALELQIETAPEPVRAAFQRWKEARDAADETGRSGATNIKWGQVDSFGNLSDAAGYPVGRVAGGGVTQPAPGIAGWVYVDPAIPGASGGPQQISVWRPGRPAPVPVNRRVTKSPLRSLAAKLIL